MNTPVHRLRHASHVIALGPDGVIKEQGSLQVVLEKGGYVHSLFKSSQGDKEKVEEKATAPESHQDVTMAREDRLGEREVESSTAVYRYYFQAIGWRNCIIFSFGAVMFAFFLKFSGIVDRRLCDGSDLLTVFRSLAPMVGRHQCTDAKSTLCLLDCHLRYIRSIGNDLALRLVLVSCWMTS